MQMNLDYDLAKPLATALKVKAPYIGIPMPGHAPLTFDRKKLSACLRGVKPVNIEVLTAEDRTVNHNPNHPNPANTHARWLVVEGYASDGRVRTRLTIRAIPAAFWRSWQGKDALKKWRDAEMRERTKVALMPTDRRMAALAKKAMVTLKRLTKELEKMGHAYALRNPAVPLFCMNEHNTEAMAYQRERISDFRSTKRMRTVVGAIAKQAAREQWSSVQLYKHLASRGYTFEKLSDMTGKQREQMGAESFADYLRHLHRFVYGTGVRNSGYRYGFKGAEKLSDSQTWGPERYIAKLADMQTRKSLQAQIDSVCQILADNGAGPIPVPDLPVTEQIQHAIAA